MRRRRRHASLHELGVCTASKRWERIAVSRSLLTCRLVSVEATSFLKMLLFP